MLVIMDLSVEEASFIAEHYFHSSLFKIAWERFHVKFSDEQRLHNTMINRVVDCFHKELVVLFLQEIRYR